MTPARTERPTVVLRTGYANPDRVADPPSWLAEVLHGLDALREFAPAHGGDGHRAPVPNGADEDVEALAGRLPGP